MSAIHLPVVSNSDLGFGAVKAYAPLPDLNDSSIAALQGQGESESFKFSPATQPNTFTPVIADVCPFREWGNISFTKTKKSSWNTLELSCKSGPCQVLLNGSKETPGCVKWMGFHTSWLPLTLGNTWQTEKQLRNNSLWLVPRATLYPWKANGTDNACPCVFQIHSIPLDKWRFKRMTYSLM